ncbi:hypothetical protein EVA_06154 [gut metagenome]|uniref:Uncharacterized protein n=1 Tax=gut metagenome TaxID=749906 RepID=J9GFP4_9ZZZZ
MFSTDNALIFLSRLRKLSNRIAQLNRKNLIVHHLTQRILLLLVSADKKLVSPFAPLPTQLQITAKHIVNTAGSRLHLIQRTSLRATVTGKLRTAHKTTHQPHTKESLNILLQVEYTRLLIRVKRLVADNHSILNAACHLLGVFADRPIPLRLLREIINILSRLCSTHILNKAVHTSKMNILQPLPDTLSYTF